MTAYHALAAAFALFLSVSGTSAGAREVAVVIRWEDVEPKSISVVTGDGAKLLNKNVAQKHFSGSVAVSDNLFTVNKLQVDYDGYSLPLLLRVRKAASQIAFLVDRYKVSSCPDLIVRRVEQPANSMDDAMRRMMTAAYMLELPPPDRECKDTLRGRTVKARLDRNTNLTERSEGLFGMTDEARQAVLAIGPTGLPGALSPEALVANADREANSALAKGLYNDMLNSSAAKDFATAAALGNEMSEAVKADNGLAAAFERQGITAGRLADDATYLNGRATM